MDQILKSVNIVENIERFQDLRAIMCLFHVFRLWCFTHPAIVMGAGIYMYGGMRQKLYFTEQPSCW